MPVKRLMKFLMGLEMGSSKEKNLIKLFNFQNHKTNRAKIYQHEGLYLKGCDSIFW